MTNNHAPHGYGDTPDFDGQTSAQDYTDPAVQQTAEYGTDLPATTADNEVVAAPSENTTSTKREKAQREKVKGSAAGSTWVALIIGALLLILLLVFILQNQQSVRLQMFAWEVNFPIGVGMLIAAITGALIMALVGGVRMIQLRRQVTHRKN